MSVPDPTVYGWPAADIIVNFLHGLSSKIGDIIDAGVELLLALLKGISDAIKKHGD